MWKLWATWTIIFLMVYLFDGPNIATLGRHCERIRRVDDRFFPVEREKNNLDRRV
jgi:hypothetical protein